MGVCPDFLSLQQCFKQTNEIFSDGQVLGHFCLFREGILLLIYLKFTLDFLQKANK